MQLISAVDVAPFLFGGGQSTAAPFLKAQLIILFLDVLLQLIHVSIPKLPIDTNTPPNPCRTIVAGMKFPI